MYLESKQKIQILPVENSIRKVINMELLELMAKRRSIRKYTEEEIRQIAHDDHFITLYGRLVDRYGDNGVVSVVIGEIKDKELHVRLWLMSCRVLKRNMEYAMLDELIHQTLIMGINKVVGYYIPTKKNKMVSTLLDDFGFQHKSDTDGMSIWDFSVPDEYKNRNKFIEILKDEAK